MSASLDQKLLARYNRQVPRYTSYPTAPHFCHEISSADVFAQLNRLRNTALCSLYLHIPFCHQLCTYCGCFTKIVNNDSPVQAYLETLKKEIRRAGAALQERPVVSHVHFGGGSPNILSGNDLDSLFDVIRENFVLAADAEVAMEMDPRLLNEEKIKSYASTGINRASLGVQDFQEKTQKAVNRIQSYDHIRKCVSWLRDAGIENINFDLMYGLPYQTVESIADNIEKTTALSPDRIALFGYAHVPWMRRHQKLLESFPLPDQEQRWQQENVARVQLTKNGYEAIGIDHFARPDDSMSCAYRKGTLRRNFQGYTTDIADVLLGFGLSAISRFSGMYVQNTTDIQNYRQEISVGRLPVKRGRILNPEDFCRAAIIEQLMCHFYVDLADICVSFDFAPDDFKDAFDSLRYLQTDEIVVIDDKKITVTDKGRPFVRLVCACFDSYYTDSDTRHAKAI